MAQLALTLVGAVGGAFVGAPGLGAAIGSVVGSFVDSMLQPGAPHQKGPQLSDKRVQVSTYGVMRPRVYATMRVAGNVIWAGKIVETAHKKSIGGGGGVKGLSSPGSTTVYTYSASFAVGLCEGPIFGIQRIWADGKLMLDNRPQASKGLAIRNLRGAKLRVYTGTQTQNPDPMIQGHQGTKFTPRFPGLAYLTFNNMQLADFGNRIPNITVEVIVSGSNAYPFTEIPMPFSVYFDGVLMDLNGPYVYFVTSGKIIKISCLTGAIVDQATTYGFNLGCIGDDGFIYCSNSDTFYCDILRLDPITLQQVGSVGNAAPFQVFDTPNHDAIPPPVQMRSGSGYIVGNSYLNIIRGTFILAESTVINGTPDGVLRFVGKTVAFFDGVIDPTSVVITQNTKVDPITKSISQVQGANFDVWVVDGTHLTRLAVQDFGGPGGSTTGTFIGPDGTNPITTMESYDLSALMAPSHVFYIEELHALCVGGGSSILRFDLATRTVTGAVLPYGTGYLSAWTAGETNGMWYAPTSINQGQLIDLTNWSVVETVGYGNYDVSLGVLNYPLLYEPKTNSLWGLGPAGSGVFLQLFLDRVAGNDVTLASIVADLSQQGGLTAGEYDVTSLTDLVHGFAMTRLAPLRDVIAPLATAYFFDGAESDYKVKFVKRGGSAVAALTTDDVGAYAYGSKRPDPFIITELPEQEIPLRWFVKYLNPFSNYQDATQASQRIVNGTVMQSKHEESVDLAIALHDNEAKGVADKLLYLAWTKRFTGASSYSRAWLKLDPTDVITLLDKTRSDTPTYTLRLTKTDLGLNGVIQFDSEFEDPGIYVTNSFGGTDDGGAQPPEPGSDQVAQSVVFFMDIPMLRDIDNDAGFYTAAGPIQSDLSWLGCIVLKSLDGGASFEPWETFTTAATIGAATSVLPAPPGNRWSSWDMVSTVTVRIFQGNADIVSAASQVAVLNGMNWALLGSEIIAYQTAVDNGDGTFTLSGLLRARKGSDALMTHSLGERFVLLSGNVGIQDAVETTGELNLNREYKVTTIGDSSLPDVVQNFTDTGKRLWPYTVQQIAGSRSGGDLTITWVRRSRTVGAWNLVTSSTLGETSEAYDVDIIKAGVVVRTISVTSPTAAYSAADQTTDFGSPQAAISINIYQKNAIVGRGFASAATV